MERAENVPYPIPINKVAHRYYIYDLTHATHLRHVHRIPGVLIGTLPQSPQQNLFSGLPVELLPEEARLLVEKGVCYIHDDTTFHAQGISALRADTPRRQKWLAQVQEMNLQASKGREEFTKYKKEVALEKLKGEERDLMLRALEKLKQQEEQQSQLSGDVTASATNTINETDNDDDQEQDTLFPAYDKAGPPATTTISSEKQPAASASTSTPSEYAITSTTSMPPLTMDPHDENHQQQQLPEVPNSYALYRYLHSEHPGSNYFISPGLRFGCQYLVYPGDPLRYHSHFLAVGRDWDQEIDLLTLVGGGRLGTGVKKGFLLGGAEKEDDSVSLTDDQLRTGKVRCFSIEWGGM